MIDLDKLHDRAMFVFGCVAYVCTLALMIGGTTLALRALWQLGNGA